MTWNAWCFAWVLVSQVCHLVCNLTISSRGFSRIAFQVRHMWLGKKTTWREIERQFHILRIINILLFILLFHVEPRYYVHLCLPSLFPDPHGWAHFIWKCSQYFQMKFSFSFFWLSSTRQSDPMWESERHKLLSWCRQINSPSYLQTHDSKIFSLVGLRSKYSLLRK